MPRKKNVDIGKNESAFYFCPENLHDTDFKSKELTCSMGGVSIYQACMMFHNHSSLFSSGYGLR